MAILAVLFALGSRFVGRVLTTALGWASTLLFGRVPASRQVLLLGVTFGSVIWMVLLAGVVFPDLGTLLLVLIPQQDVIPEDVVRLIMLIGALVAPAVVGALTLLLAAPGDRDPKAIATAVVRGYPLTALLAVLLVFLAGLSIVRKAQSALRGWTDAHVPLVVQPGRYDEVAADLDEAVTAAGLDVEPRTAPGYLSKPAKWLAAVAGTGAASLVPDRMIRLTGTDIDILIYSMDLLVSGKPKAVARARAAMASRLTTSAAHLTVTAEAQAIEDRLAALAHRDDAADAGPPRFDEDMAAAFAAIDEQLASIEIPYEEWEVIYRQRLQVERDLRVGAMAGQAVLGAATPGERSGGPLALIDEVGRAVRNGVGVVVEAVADERTGRALDRLAGPQGRLAAQLAATAALAARSMIRPDRTDQHGDEHSTTGDTGIPAQPPDDETPPAAADRSASA